MRTAINTTKTKYQVNKEQVLQCTGMDRGNYNVIVHDTAIEWIKTTISEHDEDVQRLTHNPKFWKWWINQWNIRDEVFLYEYIGFIIAKDDHSSFLLYAWEKVHDVKTIDTYPSTATMQQLYDDVMRGTMHQVQKEIKHQPNSTNHEDRK